VHDLFKTALVVCRIVAPRELMTSVEARQHCLCALIVETDEKLTECSNYARKSSVNKKFDDIFSRFDKVPELHVRTATACTALHSVARIRRKSSCRWLPARWFCTKNTSVRCSS